MWTVAGRLTAAPAGSRPDLLAPPVAAALAELPADAAARCGVVEIDPDLADTAEFCRRYGSPLEASANCVVVAGKRAGEQRFAGCVVLATTRTDVNNTVKRRLDVRKASFAPVAEATERTGMAYGGITPFGLPPEWPLLVDTAVADTEEVVVGSGLRASKLVVPGELLAKLPSAELTADLGR